MEFFSLLRPANSGRFPGTFLVPLWRKRLGCGLTALTSQFCKILRKVLVVDDHATARRGICSLLSQDPSLDVICETADGEDAVAKAEELQPDLILLDTILPGITELKPSGAFGESLGNLQSSSSVSMIQNTWRGRS